MVSKKELENGLAHCTGTEGYRYNAMYGKDFVYTDGFAYLMEAANCVWLMQAIFSYRRKEDFQLWTLKVKDGTATLTMKEDTDSPVLVNQEIKYTDFPLDEINFYAINDHCSDSGDHVVLLLRSEY